MYIIAVGGIRGRLNRLPAAACGDMVLATVKKGKPELRKKGNFYWALKKAISGIVFSTFLVMPAVVIRQRKTFRRKDGQFLYFEDNAGVIVNNKVNFETFPLKRKKKKRCAEKLKRSKITKIADFSMQCLPSKARREKNFSSFKLQAIINLKAQQGDILGTLKDFYSLSRICKCRRKNQTFVLHSLWLYHKIARIRHCYIFNFIYRVRWKVQQSQDLCPRNVQSCGPGSPLMLEASPKSALNLLLRISSDFSAVTVFLVEHLKREWGCAK